jgi:DNA-binding winged helix-turn-helix (wHTH) protein
MIQVFGDCELDEARFELRRRGTVVKIEPKTFDLLAYLIRCADRVVSKDELLDAVWPDQVVSESVLPKCVAAARRAVGDARTPARVIQTVHGRGYRFIAAVERRDPVEPAAAAAPPSAPFVGHVQAMARLRQAMESSLAGRGRVARTLLAAARTSEQRPHTSAIG